MDFNLKSRSEQWLGENRDSVAVAVAAAAILED